MKRTTHSTRKVNLFGTGLDGFTDGSPGVEAATVLESSVMNHVQEEIARAVELFGGLTLNPANYGQLAMALLAHKTRQDNARESPLVAEAQHSGSHGSQHWSWFTGDGSGSILACGEGASSAWSRDLGKTWDSNAAGSGFTGDLVQCAAGQVGSDFRPVIVGGDNLQSRLNNLAGTFTQRISGGAQFRGVCYEAVSARFVACTDSQVFTSADAIVWSGAAPANRPTHRLWTGGGVICAPGVASVRRSADAGVTWTLQPNASGATTFVLDYCSGLWWGLALSGSNVYLELSRDNGLTWTIEAAASVPSATLEWLIALPGGAYAGVSSGGSTIGVQGLAASPSGVVPPTHQPTAQHPWVSQVRPSSAGQRVIFGRNTAAAGSILRSIVG